MDKANLKIRIQELTERKRSLAGDVFTVKARKEISDEIYQLKLLLKR